MCSVSVSVLCGAASAAVVRSPPDADGRLSREVEYEYSKKLQSTGGRLLADGALSLGGGKRKKLVFSTLQGFLSDARALLVGKTAFCSSCSQSQESLPSAPNHLSV